MQAAIIPPIPHLNTIQDRKFHLVLSHLLAPDVPGSSEYRFFYQTLKSKDSESFVILDNSAHENTQGEIISSVLALGQSIQADEIVIPDRLFDGPSTVDLARGSFEYLLSPGGASLYRSYQPRLMVVPQGKSRRDYIQCARDLTILLREFRREYLSRYHWRIPLTIGVSKDYEIWDGDLLDIVGLTILPIASSFPDCNVHILGWGHNLWGHRRLAEKYGDQIRSTDSAKPWVYGINRIRLDSHYLDIPTYPKRSPSYFYDLVDQGMLEDSLFNIDVFDATCRGEVLR